MKYFLTLTYCFAFSAVLSAQQAFLDEFQQKWKNAEAYTLESIELMPEDAFGYKPTEEQRSFQDQIIHSCRNMIWLSSSYLGGDKSGIDFSQKDLSKADLIAMVKTCFQRSGEAAANLKPEDLEEKVSFFAGPMSKRQILVLMNDHSTHHRAQMLVYLRLKGLTPPKYRGW